MVCAAWTSSNCKKEFVAHDTVSLTLKCNRLVKMGAAGQHHPVIVEIAGRRYERTYSLTQIDAEHLRLTVKKVADGIVSNWFIAESKIGDVFELGQPYGDMQQNIQTPKLIMLAAGSGITPMLSLITAIKQSQQLEKRRFSFYIGSNSVLMLLLQSTLNKWLNKTQTLAIRCFTHKKHQMMNV